MRDGHGARPRIRLRQTGGSRLSDGFGIIGGAGLRPSQDRLGALPHVVLPQPRPGAHDGVVTYDVPSNPVPLLAQALIAELYDTQFGFNSSSFVLSYRDVRRSRTDWAWAADRSLRDGPRDQSSIMVE